MARQKGSTSFKKDRQRQQSWSVAIGLLFGIFPVVLGGADGIPAFTARCRRARKENKQQVFVLRATHLHATFHADILIQKLEPVSALHPRALIVAIIYNFLIIRPGRYTKLLDLCILHQKYITHMPAPLVSTATVDRLTHGPESPTWALHHANGSSAAAAGMDNTKNPGAENTQCCMDSGATVEEVSSHEDSSDAGAVPSQAQELQEIINPNIDMPSGSPTALAHVFQGLPSPEVHAPELPAYPCSSAIPCLNTHHGSDSPAEASYKGTTPQDMEDDTQVRARTDEDGDDGAGSTLSSLTHPSQDVCDNSETETGSNDAQADAANAASSSITACGSKESATRFLCQEGSEPSARQVYGATATWYAQAAATAAAEAALHARLAALYAGVLPKGAQPPPQRPDAPDAGYMDCSASTSAASFYTAASDLSSSHLSSHLSARAEPVCSSTDPEHSDYATTTSANSFASSLDTHSDVYGAQAEPASLKKTIPSLKNWAKNSLKGLKKMGRRMNDRIQSCATMPKVKDCSTEEHACTPKESPIVMTPAEALITTTMAC